MDQRLFTNLEGKELEAALLDNADGVENDSYTVKLTEDELIDRKDQLTDLTIDMSIMEDEHKETSKLHKDRLKPKKTESKQLMKEIKAKSIVITGKLFKFAYPEEGMVAFYDHKGELVNSRRMRPDERQTSIRSLNKAI